MKKLFKHKVLFLGFTIILTVNSLASDKILPKSKPKPDKEIVIKVEEKKPVVLDFESIQMVQPGRYEIDLIHLTLI